MTTDDALTAARQCFTEGLACHRAGRLAEAERLYRQSLALLPDRVSTLINLAAVQLALSRPDDALATTERILAAEAGNAEACLHRSTALLQLGRAAEALEAADGLLAQDPQHALGWVRHAEALERLDRDEDALQSYRRALTLQPGFVAAWNGLGNLLRERDHPAEAAKAYRQALAAGADPQLQAYYLAAVAGGATPPAAPPAYVRRLFDQYAAEFDEQLVERLDYQGHRELIQGLARAGAPASYASALDLGCGTGLCGPLLRPLAARLLGVDLSGAMLERARALGVYDHLAEEELLQHLQGSTERHDLVVACDVFIYLGDLAPVFEAVRRIVSAGGIFCFTIEPAPAQGPAVRLLPSLRYAHRESHLRTLASEHGWRVLDARLAPLRVEQGAAIPGLYVYLLAR